MQTGLMMRCIGRARDGLLKKNLVRRPAQGGIRKAAAYPLAPTGDSLKARPANLLVPVKACIVTYNSTVMKERQ